MKSLQQFINENETKKSFSDIGVIRSDSMVPGATRGGSLVVLPSNHPSQARTVDKLVYDMLVPNKKIAEASLWGHLIRGKDFKTFHWYYLFREVERQKRLDPLVFVAKVGLLSLSTQRKLVNKFNVNHTKVRQKLQGGPVLVTDRLGFKEKSYDSLEIMFREILGIPKRLLPINDLLNFRIESHTYSKSKDVARIGVGYKDKGTLGSPRSIELGDIPLDPDFPLNDEKISWSLALDEFETLMKTLFYRYKK